MKLRYPIQKLSYVKQHQSGRHILLGASGPSILSISPDNGRVLRQWPSTSSDETSDSDLDITDAPPAKRRKIAAEHESDASQDSIEIVAERKKGERKRTKTIDSKLPNVSHLRTTKDGQHVVAVTADDKSIKVFQLKPSGRLVLLSERSLPKRLCALDLTTDERTILAADKFGDVHSLPLHPSKDYVPKVPSAVVEVPYSPAATELTVHTKGNREALKQQLEQKKFKPRKEGPGFEHQLLLGHVSLLTDLLVATGQVNGRERPFILTADRDEHVRVSRGIPQAHIIETYCLGHQEFISRLCIPSWAPDVLIAGNGEPSLRLFRWQTGEQLAITEIIPAIPEEFTRDTEVDGHVKEKFTVSGIWALEHDTTNGNDVSRQLAVAIEGLPMLLIYVLTSDHQLQHINTVKTDGNVLDLVQAAADKLLVSVDVAHKAASVKHLRATDDDAISPLHVFTMKSTLSQPQTFSYTWERAAFPSADELSAYLPVIENDSSNGDVRSKGYEKLYSDVGEFIYGLENLRKKRDAMAEDEAAEAEEIAQ